MAATLRKYVSVKPSSGSGPLHEATKTITVAHNRLGGAVTYLGKQVIDFKEVFNVHRDFTLNYFKSEKELLQKEHEHKQEIIDKQTDILGRKKGLEQDKRAEEKQEEVTDKQAKDEGKKLAKKEKKKFGWFKAFFEGFQPIFKVIAEYVAIFAAYQFMDWLSDPKNKEAIETITRLVGGMWSFSRKLAEFGINNVMDGITRVFTDDPTKEGVEEVFDDMFGVLQIIGGLAGLWAASRVLMPWKLIGDVKFMTSLGRAVSIAEQTDGGGKKRPNRGNKKGRDGRTARERLRDQRNRQRPTRPTRPTGATRQRGIFGRAIDGLRNVGSKAKRGLVQAGGVVKNTAVGAMNFIGDQAKGLWNGAKSFAGSAWAQGQKIAKSIGNLAEIAKDPKKLGQVVKTKLKATLQNVVDNNDTIKKVKDVAKNPGGQGKKVLIDLFKGAVKNPGFKNFREFLGGVKANFKIGGIDTVIAALMGLLDYGAFGESPINAIVNALAGLLGYSAGFAIGAPFGGVPGFITGAAGAFAGEWIGNKILEGLGIAFPNLLEMDDPVAKMIAESGDGAINEMFKDRKMLRDPNTEMPGFEDAASQELADGGKILKDVPYLNQRANKQDKFGRKGDTQCYSTTMAMWTSYLTGKALSSEEYNKVRQKYGDSTNAGPQKKALKDFGINSNLLVGAYGHDTLRKEIDAGYPVPLGFKYKGSGHWGMLVGYDSNGWVVHDPFGQLGIGGVWKKTNSSGSKTNGPGKYYRMSSEIFNNQMPANDMYFWKAPRSINVNAKFGGEANPDSGDAGGQITEAGSDSASDLAPVAGESMTPPSKPMTAMEAFNQVGGLDMLNSFLGDIGGSDLGKSGFGSSPSPSPVATPAEIKQEESLINTKSSQLAAASVDKVRRDKQRGQNNTAVLMYRQQVGVPGPPAAQVVKASTSPTPLLTK